MPRPHLRLSCQGWFLVRVVWTKRRFYKFTHEVVRLLLESDAKTGRANRLGETATCLQCEFGMVLVLFFMLQ